MDIHEQGVDKEAPRIQRGDIYAYSSSTEQESPDLAFLAQQVHAQSYKNEGFVYEDAIDDDGRIVSDIDKSRGDSVRYFLGFDDSGEPVSTLRTIRASDEDGVLSLPGYRMCRGMLTTEGEQFLLDAELEGRTIEEISSFGHVDRVSSQAGVEILRHSFQEAYTSGNGGVWFFAMVTPKLQSLLHMFGPRAIRKIGHDMPLDDSRVADITLTPATLNIPTFFDDIKDSIYEEKDPLKRRRYLKYLQYYAEGIDPKKLSDEVNFLLRGVHDFDLVEYSRKKRVSSGQDGWSQPIQLDLSDRLDRARSRRMVDQGEVDKVIDPDWHKEFGDGSGEGLSQRDGSWFYYPWNRSLIHFPDKDAYSEMRHSRDRNLVTSEDQRLLDENLDGKAALYAGLSVGSHILEHMVYAGIGGSHILSDFDKISVSNLNRIHAGMHNVGERKDDFAAKRVSELDPYIRQQFARDGINKETLGSIESEISIIYDAVDDFAAKALLRQYAKEHKIPLIMATDVGYKSIIDIERHDIEDIKPFNGRLSDAEFEKMLEGSLTSKERMKIMTRIIGLSNASFRLLESVQDPSLRGFPQLEVTASQGGALATIASRDILLGRKVSSGRRVHDARKTLKLPAEVALLDGMKTLKNFLSNN